MKHKRFFKKLAVFSTSTLFLFGSLAATYISPASALSGSQFNAGRIIDDTKFFAGADMSASQIQSFLNAKTPNCDTNGSQQYGSTGQTRKQYAASRGVSTPFICLKNKVGQIQNRAGSAGLCSSLSFQDKRTAAQIIYKVSLACGVSPKVILVLLQKEQSLVTDEWPWPIQYRSATGYGCPDTAPCNSEYYGFFNQVYNAAKQFKRYGRDAHLFNYKKKTTGYVQYNPNAGCGGTNVYIQNQATASLYNYTPYQPNQAALNNLYGTGDGCSAYGNRNFWRMYNDWFGQTTAGSCVDGTNLADESAGKRVIHSSGGLIHTKLNKTGTECTEVHFWNNNLNSWKSNLPTNLVSQNPNNKRIITGDIMGDNKDETILVKYASGSGKVEFHVWNKKHNRWAKNTVTNLNSFDPAIGRIITSDYDNDGKDEMLFVKYKDTAAGKVEVHVWNDNYKSWRKHITTNIDNLEPSTGRIVSGNVLGKRRDELVYVKYQDTAAGFVEVHIWHHGYKKWRRHYTTNVPEMSTRTNRIISGNLVGGERDELIYIKYDGTGSGKVEAHVWNQDGYDSWKANYSTNLDSFDPAL